MGNRAGEWKVEEREEYNPKVEMAPFRGPNERSPRRHGRIHPQVREKEAAKRHWLRVYRVTGDMRLASSMVGRHVVTVWWWGRNDPLFKAEWGRLRESWAAVMEERMGGLAMEAVEVLGESMRQTKDKRVRAEVALGVLKGRGHLGQRAVVEVVGEGGGPIRIREVEVVEVVEGVVLEVRGGEETIREGGGA